MPKQPLILLVEDREDDVVLIRHAFERVKADSKIHVCRDGEEAIEYLEGKGRYSNRDEYPLPRLVLLDLKMPRVDGFEVLEWIRQRDGLKSLIVVVLTSSHDMKDISRAYALGAKSFMIKPLDFENTAALADLINRYWLRHNRTPALIRAPGPTNEERRGINGGRAS
jgi:CheY-like chemotaxis protein